MQARKHQSNILKVLKQSKTQPRIIYTGKIFFKSEGKINISFSNTKKQAEFITSKPVLQEMLKEVLQAKGGCSAINQIYAKERRTLETVTT